MQIEPISIMQAPSNQSAQTNTLQDDNTKDLIQKSVITSDSARVQWEKMKQYFGDIQNRTNQAQTNKNNQQQWQTQQQTK